MQVKRIFSFFSSFADCRVVLGGGVAYYYWHLDTVPVSGRKRFLNISRETEKKLGHSAFLNFGVKYRENTLPSNSKDVIAVEKVLKRISKSSGIEGFQDIRWNVLVVKSPIPNAFVLPGGYCVVFTGIFPICKNLDGLATVLAHEAAHVLARHGAEHLSMATVWLPFVLAFSHLFGVPFWTLNSMSKLLIELPNSRAHESEADAIGLMLMARACYSPQEAVEFWKRYSELTKGGAPAEFLSTHPANQTRIEQIQRLMPKAVAERVKNCT